MRKNIYAMTVSIDRLSCLHPRFYPLLRLGTTERSLAHARLCLALGLLSLASIVHNRQHTLQPAQP